MVAAGILVSRLAGVVRQRVLAHALGLGDAADAFAAAFRIPNFLQNLLGEGVLSASFIPVYTRLRKEQGDEAAHALAGAVLGMLAMVVSLIVALGVALAPTLVDLLAPGFTGLRRDLTIQLLRLFFPGIGILVLSAWCLGVLNSHRRFFLSYAAPVAWNAAIIVVVLAAGSRLPEEAALWAAWGAFTGSVLQFAVQLPAVIRLTGPIRPRLSLRQEGMGTTLATFVPAVLSRGVVQVSGFIDGIIASLLPVGAVAALLNAQLLYLLPVNLFGTSFSAAELPEMAETDRSATGHAVLRHRIAQGLERMAFFVIPSALVLLCFGGVAAAAVFQTGRFSAADAEYVWLIMAGFAPGLLATTQSRMLASGWYALHDTRPPLRAAVLRVGLGIPLGFIAAVYLPGWLGLAPRFGAAGLTAAASVAGWLEWWLLKRSLSARIGGWEGTAAVTVRTWLAGLGAVAAAFPVQRALTAGPIVTALLVLGTFGLVYLGLAWLLRVPTVRRQP